MMVIDAVLLFGGVWRNATDSIYQYKLDEKTWNLLPVSTPAALSSFGCVTVLNDKDVLLFGGTDEYEMSDDICIYCVQDRSFRK